jgi:hypothetical protein
LMPWLTTCASSTSRVSIHSGRHWHDTCLSLPILTGMTQPLLINSHLCCTGK